MYVINRTRGTYLGINVRAADSFRKRLLGLYGYGRFRLGDGLWLVPCNSIQTIGLRYPIDVVFLDRGNRVVRIFENVRPGRVIWPVRGAYSTLELPAGVVRSSETQVGDQTEFVSNLEQPRREPARVATSDGKYPDAVTGGSDGI